MDILEMKHLHNVQKNALYDEHRRLARTFDVVLEAYEEARAELAKK
jgi:hypothetical protein